MQSIYSTSPTPLQGGDLHNHIDHGAYRAIKLAVHNVLATRSKHFQRSDMQTPWTYRVGLHQPRVQTLSPIAMRMWLTITEHYDSTMMRLHATESLMFELGKRMKTYLLENMMTK